MYFMNILHEHVLFKLYKYPKERARLLHICTRFLIKNFARIQNRLFFWGGGGMSEEYFDQFAS